MSAAKKEKMPEKMPGGIPYIVMNEMAERFSFYGMKAILVVFMTKYLMTSGGQPDLMTDQEANVWYHLFGSAVYFFPIIGALVSDIWWGKYKTILSLSIVYCLGHLALAVFETRFGLALGLGLIAVGSGGIKPCVSAHVGDQFDDSNKGLLAKIFSIFYFSINFGAVFSTFLIPILLEKYGPSVAFGVPGILMFLATMFFWMGRTKFIAIEAVGWEKYFNDVFSPQGGKAILGLGVLYVFIAMFWALFDQTGSSWVLQAESMDKFVDLRFGPFQMEWLQFELLASQIQGLNPLLVMLYIPLFSFGLYPLVGKVCKVTPLRKIGAGFFVTALAFAISAHIETLIAAGQNPSILWQFLAYAIITSGEILISITALEFSYTQAPNSMKSIIMGVFLLSVSLGNIITATVNKFIQNDDGTVALVGADYYMFFVKLVLVAGVLFIFAAKAYKEESYIQEGGIVGH